MSAGKEVPEEEGGGGVIWGSEGIFGFGEDYYRSVGFLSIYVGLFPITTCY